MPTTTADQRREQARQEYNAFLDGCPTREVLATVGNKWSALVVTALEDGPLRHGQLATRIAGASQKMLTQTLRTLERDGVVSRTVTASVPVRVDYELTALGRGLVPLLHALKTWSESHIEQIQDAREAYDARPAASSTSPR